MLSQCYIHILLLKIAFNSSILYSVANVDYIFISPFIVYWYHRPLHWLKYYLSWFIYCQGFFHSTVKNTWHKPFRTRELLQKKPSTFWLCAEMTQPLLHSKLAMTEQLCFSCSYSVTPEDKDAISHLLSDCIIVCIEGSIKFPPGSARSILMPLMLKWFTYFFNQRAKRKHHYNGTNLNGKLIKPL